RPSGPARPDGRAVPDQPEPPALALLRTELGRVDQPPLARRGELDPVLAPRDVDGPGRHPRDRSPAILRQATHGGTLARGPRYNRVIGVDEVEVGARRNALEE